MLFSNPVTDGFCREVGKLTYLKRKTKQINLIKKPCNLYIPTRFLCPFLSLSLSLPLSLSLLLSLFLSLSFLFPFLLWIPIWFGKGGGVRHETSHWVFWGIGNVFSITLYTQQEESFGCLNSIHSGLKLDLRSIWKMVFNTFFSEFVALVLLD